VRMKNSIWIIGALSIATVFTGCKPADSSEKRVSDQMDRVQADATEAQKDLNAFTHDQKEQFVESLSNRIAALDKELDELTAEVNKSSSTVQAEARPRLAALRTQSDQLKEQLNQAKGASASTWESVKAGTSKAYDDLKAGFQSTRQWMSEKIAP